MVLAGIDLAWNGETNSSAVAMGRLEGQVLTLTHVAPALTGLASLMDHVTGTDGLTGIAIDASLIITNQTGQRPCEKALARLYAAKKAACHATNLNLYPDPFSVHFSHLLADHGFQHLGSTKWQIECYPHPSIIEIFGLSERLKYKKGAVSCKRKGQQTLASLIKRLVASPKLSLVIPKTLAHYTDPAHISSLKGKALKSNEDALDALICLYVAALYAIGAPHHVFGDTETGYIWVPTGF